MLLHRVLKEELEQRERLRKIRLFQRAAFPVRKTLEGYEFNALRLPSSLTPDELTSCQFVQDKKNLVLYGPVGTGKTYLSNALGVAACRQLYKVKYIRMPELLVDMNIARDDGSYKDLMVSYKKLQLLILDEWMHQPISETQAGDVFEIVESRFQDSSTIFVAQSEPAGWHRQIGNGVIADAILDRIVYNSYEIMLGGDVNMRKCVGFK